MAAMRGEGGEGGEMEGMGVGWRREGPGFIRARGRGGRPNGDATGGAGSGDCDGRAARLGTGLGATTTATRRASGAAVARGARRRFDGCYRLQLPQVLVVSRRPPRWRKLANHALVLGATFLKLRCRDEVLLLSDGNRELAHAMGVELDVRSRRRRLVAGRPPDLLVSCLALAASSPSTGRPAEQK
uniref:Uncharacterized protein n=1 Tax=Oryza sativa subsp. japonica TaxID=39947 RepID=Q2QQD5_ORYSJ|nr:hypothetical protein LOC_Os12g31420 [Oryza sativa Japonica Group]